MTDRNAAEPNADLVRQFVLASHGRLDTVREMLEANPALLTKPHVWGPDDLETPLAAASHVGNRPIAEFLLEQGAPLDVFAAAMLGRAEDVERMLDDDPSLVDTTGAHGFSLMFHVALGGRVDIAERVAAVKPPPAADLNQALQAAVFSGHVEMARWLLENGVTDPSTQDHKGRTPLEVAESLGQDEIAALLRAAGATGTDTETDDAVSGAGAEE